MVAQLRRKSRSVALEAGRAAPILARQLRALAARYEEEAEQLDTDSQRSFAS
ncbi:MAG TPA: hypothetical protein VMU87_07025 [Stellaceae bacterium]|nr:hypothetical protein [Stellaceae bacterium]